MLSSYHILIFVLSMPVAGMLLLLLYRIRQQPDKRRFYPLIATLMCSLVVFMGHLLPLNLQVTASLGRDFFIWLALIITQTAFGSVVLYDTLRYQRIKNIDRVFFGVCAVWVIGFIGLSLIQTDLFMGWSGWNQQQNFYAGLYGAAGGMVSGLFIAGFAFYNFYLTPMPEVANRSAMTVFLTALYMVSFALISSGADALMVNGLLMLALSLGGATYITLYHRVTDVRRGIVAFSRISLTTLFTWSLTFGALYFVYRASMEQTLINVILLGGVALIVAVLFIPARQIIDDIFEYVWRRSKSTPELAAAIATYTRHVSSAASLEEVVQATTQTLNSVVKVNRSALILINTTHRVPDSVELIVLESGSTLENPASRGVISQMSPAYHRLAVKKLALTQFDLDYNDAYRNLAPSEQQFFRQLNMRAYIPIVTDNRLIGLLGCGQKRNDTPFYHDDIEMLMVIGQQVGTALRNARLIDDLQHLNTSMRTLNKRLENARTELEKLDSVKTDFVTIASHELRTPLAQIRGYTDIIDSMNDEKLLTPEQTTNMVASLRRSTDRMGELISAMLDMSQLDVAAMDLRFMSASVETITKMAIEQLQDALSSRNQTVTTEGLDELPRIQADMQRLVQALRNLIQNAIKFTPDGGRIHITASYEANNAESASDYILLSISDDGVGIAAKDIELIFQKFYRGFDTQLHSSGAYKFMGAGPGLGLTIARGIIEGHGGKIRAESPGHSMEERPGTTFYVQLPLHPPEGKRRVLPFESEDGGEHTKQNTAMNAMASAASGETEGVKTLRPEETDTEANTPASISVDSANL